MVKYSCHVHTTRIMREVGQPPHYMVMVAPAGVDFKCVVCGKKALWGVNPA